MKAVMIGLALSLFLVMGCGKKGESKTQEQAKATSKPVAVLWEFETGGWVTSSPAIGSDGTVYGGSRDNKLYAINGKSGVKLWNFKREVMCGPPRHRL